MTESILIVDDSTFIVEGLAALLKKNYKPILSYSGEECLDILRTTTPSLIILDIMMEPMDGWETLARIKADPKTRHIPVLMFSAKKISPVEAEAHRIIIDDFITKPVNPKELIEAIEKVLARQNFNRQVVGAWTAAGVPPETIDEYLTLKMNLDVDISLLAVMQKQLEMAYTGAVNREELIESIAALEERIEMTRIRIESFCRERQGDLPVVEPEPPRQDAEDYTDTAGPADQDAGPEGPGPLHAPVIEEPPEGPGPDTVPVVPDPAVEPERTDEQPHPLHPDEGRVPVAAKPGQPGPDEAPAFPVSFPVIAPVTEPQPGPVPQPEAKGAANDPGEQVPSVLQVAVEDHVVAGQGAVSEVPHAKRLESLFEPFETDAREPVFPRPESGHSNARNAGAVSDTAHNTFTGSEQSPAPGSGTDTPRMRTLEATSRIEQAEKRESEYAARHNPAGSRGLFSRILAAITSIFRRP